MLQDLDTLAARIGQLVQLTRQLQAERAAMQSRLADLEHEGSQLRDQLTQQRAEHESVAQRLAEYDMQAARAQAQADASLDALRAQSEASQRELRLEVARYQADCEQARQSLHVSQAESARLRAAATSAKEQLDALLERLPGAPQE